MPQFLSNQTEPERRANERRLNHQSDFAAAMRFFHANLLVDSFTKLGQAMPFSMPLTGSPKTNANASLTMNARVGFAFDE
jgi:hypothetical protein